MNNKSLRAESLKSWQQARFGMFVHWGLFSAGDLGTWMMSDMAVPVDEYARKYVPGFTGENFDAEEIVELAKNAGCKYVVMVTRHHEGYCLWDTETTDFSSVKQIPGRDFIGEYVKAARKAGLKVGLYYSLCDWRYKGYWQGPRQNPKGWEKQVKLVHNQVREIMSNYGKIDILWYDGGWEAYPGAWGIKLTDEKVANYWQSEKLNAMVRKLQPGILINNRSFLPEDFGTPEKMIRPQARPWELCDTIGFYWGASSKDLDRKTSRTLIGQLLYSVSRGGNMLLNIGPKPDGSLLPWQKKTMEEIGTWLKKHGEGVYGCEGVWEMPFARILTPWQATQKGNSMYLHLLRYPGKSFAISNQHDLKIVSAELVDTGDKLHVETTATRDIISGLPAKSPDKIASLVKLKVRKKTARQIAQRQYIGIDNPI